MKKETFEKWYEEYRKGTYVVIVKETYHGEFTKQTRMVVRFVNYYNIESVIAKGKSEKDSKARDYEETYIPHILKLNRNTNNILLNCYVTNHHKAHSRYFYQGYEISEEEYYEQSGDTKKNYPQSVLYSMKLEDIVSVGGRQ